MFDEGLDFLADDIYLVSNLSSMLRIVVFKSFEIKNSNTIFTFTVDDNTQVTFISDYIGMFALVIDNKKKNHDRKYL